MFKKIGLMFILTASVFFGAGCPKEEIATGLPGEGVDDGDTWGTEFGVQEETQGFQSFEETKSRVESDLSPVQFGYDSFQIAPREMEKIEVVAEYLKANRDTFLIIEGHCDERGSRDYNLSLGDRRALSVRTYLESLGIEFSRIQTKSFGEEQPLDAGHNEAAWRLNRRGEFVIYQ
jgi:peptidoglycan-associated lipoprotein